MQKNRRREGAERGYSVIRMSWPDPAKQEIHLECPPGEPRPGNLLPELLHGTGLPVRDDIGRLFGIWMWDYRDIPRGCVGGCGPGYRTPNDTAFQ
jgi:hypothetical protein